MRDWDGNFVIQFWDCDNIERIPVINRPSYSLINNNGRDPEYLSILEPVDKFKRTKELEKLAEQYKSSDELIAAWDKEVPTGTLKTGYSKADMIDVKFMGFRWKWRPNYKSRYGSIPKTYVLLPLIARWIVLTGSLGGIYNYGDAYLPRGYKDGTGKGFLKIYDNPIIGNAYAFQNGSHIKDVGDDPVYYQSAAIPKAKNPVERAALCNIIPKCVFDTYDDIIGRLDELGYHIVDNEDNFNYVVKCEDRNGNIVYVGATFSSLKQNLIYTTVIYCAEADKNIWVNFEYLDGKSAEESDAFFAEHGCVAWSNPDEEWRQKWLRQ